jgi:hypothetical protein
MIECRDRVYKREFERYLAAHFLTNIHGMVVVV